MTTTDKIFRLQRIALSAATVKAICDYAGQMSRANVYLALPVCPEGTNRWEDERNGEVRVGGYVPRKTVTGKGANRKVERGEECVSEVWADGNGSGEYLRVDVRESDTFLALLKVAAQSPEVRKGNKVYIRVNMEPWTSHGEARRPCRFTLPSYKEGEQAVHGTVANIFIETGTGMSKFTLTEVVFDMNWGSQFGDAFTSYNRGGEHKPLTAAPADAAQTEAR